MQRDQAFDESFGLVPTNVNNSVGINTFDLPQANVFSTPPTHDQRTITSQYLTEYAQYPQHPQPRTAYSQNPYNSAAYHGNQSTPRSHATSHNEQPLPVQPQTSMPVVTQPSGSADPWYGQHGSWSDLTTYNDVQVNSTNDPSQPQLNTVHDNQSQDPPTKVHKSRKGHTKNAAKKIRNGLSKEQLRKDARESGSNPWKCQVPGCTHGSRNRTTFQSHARASSNYERVHGKVLVECYCGKRACTWRSIQKHCEERHCGDVEGLRGKHVSRPFLPPPVTDDPNACQVCSRISICSKHEQYFCNCAQSGSDFCITHSQALREPYFDVRNSAETQSREPGYFQPSDRGYGLAIYDDMAPTQTPSTMSSSSDLSPPDLQHFESPEESMSIGPSTPAASEGGASNGAFSRAQNHGHFHATDATINRVSSEKSSHQAYYGYQPGQWRERHDRSSYAGEQGHSVANTNMLAQGYDTGSASRPCFQSTQMRMDAATDAQMAEPTFEQQTEVPLSNGINLDDLDAYSIEQLQSIYGRKVAEKQAREEGRIRVEVYHQKTNFEPSDYDGTSAGQTPGLEYDKSPEDSAYSGPSTPEEDLQYGTPVQAPETRIFEELDAETREAFDNVFSVCRCESGMCFMHNVGLEFMKEALR